MTDQEGEAWHSAISKATAKAIRYALPAKLGSYFLESVISAYSTALNVKRPSVAR